MSPLESRLRATGEALYHHRHPFHRLMHEGRLTRGQLQAWALNRYYYQSRIPLKDAAILARMEDPALRRAWRQRLVDHDGTADGDGGIARWLRLAEGLGLDPARVERLDGVLPAARFAVDAYVAFVRERPLVEAIASCLTELFAPDLIAHRVARLLEAYPFVPREALAYFDVRLDQAPRDAQSALTWVESAARTPEQQDAVVEALRFKCSVLWAQLDAVHHCYVVPGHVPPGAFVPEAA